MRASLISYYIHTGGMEVGDLFRPYVWGQHGLGSVLEACTLRDGYGHGLTLVLIQYFVEGEFSTGGPIEPKVSNYSTKNKDIAVAFPVTRDKFHDVGERQRRQFIVATTLQAIDMVEARLAKRKLDIDFERLRNDVLAAAKEYLDQPGQIGI